MGSGTTRTRAMRWSATGWRNRVLEVLVTTMLGAASPRIGRWARWPAGAGRRGVAVYVVVSTFVLFGLGELLHRARAEYAQVVSEARARAGREPTQSELRDQFGRRMLRRRLGREPTDEELERALRPDAA